VAGWAAATVLKRGIESADVDSEFHFLLSPAHPDFSQIQIGKQQSLVFDARLR
jgi:hypothetical protein